MISIRKYTDKLSFIQLKGDDFDKAGYIIRDLPVRDYNKHLKGWLVPIKDLGKLAYKAKQAKIDMALETQLKQDFKNIREWENNQVDIKENEYDFSGEFENIFSNGYSLKPFQTIGAYFIYNCGKAIIGDMVGLGKTIQSLAAVEKHYKEGNINYCIIICPATLNRNWRDEIKTFLNKEALIIEGAKSKRKRLYKTAAEYDYLIINYEMLVWDLENFNTYILERSYEFALIIDEIQYIKNNSAKRSKFTKSIAEHAKYAFGLSATILENSMLDLWSIFHAIDPTVMGSRDGWKHFTDTFIMSDWFGSEVVDLNKEKYNQTKYIERIQSFNITAMKKSKKLKTALERLEEINSKLKHREILKKRMNPYYIRRFKEDVLDQLPDIVEINYWMELSKVQRDFYNEIENEIYEKISDMERKKQIKSAVRNEEGFANILSMITFLRQCVLSAKLVGHEKNISSKLDELKIFLEGFGKHNKLVIFCQYKKMVELLSDELKRLGWNNVGIHSGNCKKEDRVNVINRFNKSFDLPILITSDILREGINLTSANYVVNFDLLWNPAKMEQRVGRVDRMGNVWKKITVINFLARNTVDERVYDKMFGKKMMSRSILDDNRIEARMKFKDIKSIIGRN